MPPCLWELGFPTAGGGPAVRVIFSEAVGRAFAAVLGGVGLALLATTLVVPRRCGRALVWPRADTREWQVAIEPAAGDLTELELAWVWAPGLEVPPALGGIPVGRVSRPWWALVALEQTLILLAGGAVLAWLARRARRQAAFPDG